MNSINWTRQKFIIHPDDSTLSMGWLTETLLEEDLLLFPLEKSVNQIKNLLVFSIISNAPLAQWPSYLTSRWLVIQLPKAQLSHRLVVEWATVTVSEVDFCVAPTFSLKFTRVTKHTIFLIINDGKMSNHKTPKWTSTNFWRISSQICSCSCSA